MDIREVARKGGLSRSPAKRAASAANLAKARAVFQQTIRDYKQQQKAAQEAALKNAPPIAVLLVSKGGK